MKSLLAPILTLTILGGLAAAPATTLAADHHRTSVSVGINLGGVGLFFNSGSRYHRDYCPPPVFIPRREFRRDWDRRHDWDRHGEWSHDRGWHRR